MLIYDIACQYSVHLHDRIGHLLPMGMEIDRAIGLFHVHAHREQCLYRFSSSFIPGSGIVAGEILESLWSSLNTITPSTRTATLAHRDEVIDDHSADSNFKKMIAMREPKIHTSSDLFADIDPIAYVLCDKFRHAKVMINEATKYFSQLSATIPQHERQSWEVEIQAAEANRLQDPSFMDVMGARQDPQSFNTEQTTIAGPAPGCEWLLLALDMEERQ